MRQDQYEKLQQLTEKLTDVLLTEADPDKWQGNGVEPTSWDQQTRGDRYWMKKNAAATITLVMKTANLTDVIRMKSAAGEEGGAAVSEEQGTGDLDETNLDTEIATYEKQALQLLEKVQNHGKTVTGKKANGKKAN